MVRPDGRQGPAPGRENDGEQVVVGGARRQGGRRDRSCFPPPLGGRGGWTDGPSPAVGQEWDLSQFVLKQEVTLLSATPG
jgi:hypothetical protein